LTVWVCGAAGVVVVVGPPAMVVLDARVGDTGHALHVLLV